MTKIIENKRILLKRSTISGQVPTVAPTNDHTDGTWSDLDIYDSELFVNIPDKRIFTRVGSSIINISHIFANTLPLGDPTTGDFLGGFITLTSASITTDIIRDINNIIRAGLPEPPQSLSGLDFVMDLYTALEVVTGTSHNCTDDTTPRGEINNFFNGDSGTLASWLDGVLSNSRVLTVADDSGTYGDLVIISDEDPNLGQQSEGVYKQLSAAIQIISALSLGLHTFQLRHSVTGNSNIKTFYIDNPGTPVIQNIVTELPVSNSLFISGVPSLDISDIILLDFRIVGAVGNHYNNGKVAEALGADINTLTFFPSSPPIQNANIDFTGANISFIIGYSETTAFAIIGYNSKNIAGTTNNVSLQARRDLLSDESTRVQAGSGEYPTVYGGIYDPTETLDNYSEELQLINGKYKLPSGDYSVNLPTAGPDYDALATSGDRWVMNSDWDINIKDALGVQLKINNPINFSSTIESLVKIQVKIEGKTGWLDANTAYSSGNPINDGDAALIETLSTSDIKVITFGNLTYTGIVKVRIGLTYPSTQQFGSITVVEGDKGEASEPRITTVSVGSGDQPITIIEEGYIDDTYKFSFQAYDSDGYVLFPNFVSKTATTVTLNMPQPGIVTLTTKR